MVYYRKIKINHKTCMSTTFAIVENENNSLRHDEK